ncbi:MAG TPA: ATP-dependent zinc metalloprotease FtsH [Acholeplasmataceae bacterium]|nr:ATP-dependent zinc metalloprotease FtsH [Acholeplasmataceae bacterium]
MAQGPQLRPKKGKSLDFGVIAIVILLIVGIFIFMRNITGRPDELSYTDFKEYVEDGRIQSVTVTPVGGENIGLDNITGEYIDEDGNKAYFSVIIDREDFKANFQPNLIAQGVEINYNKLTSSNWLSIITFLLPIVLFIGLMVFLLRNTNAGNNRAFDFGKTRAKLSRHSKTTFKDVAGVDEEKEELEEVIDFLKYPRKYFEIGARIPKGILLVGPPGTGKTLLAKAVAGEAKVPFFSISGSDFVEMFVGVGASRVRDMFKNAKQAAPCIVFIDEIDAVGRQRGAGLGGGHDEREQTLNQLLVEMDGFEENSGVIVMAATNRVDVLDPALLRPGRFDRQIRISNPDVRGRTEILKVHARNKKISPKVNLEEIAKRTPGFSGADLENLLNEAALLAAREGRKEIKIYDIDEAIDRVLMGPAKKSRKYSLQEKRIVSYHEAGHAVIGIKLENADVVQKVTIVPRGEAGGYNLMTPEEERFLQTKSSLLDNITGLLAGRAAEELMIGEITTGAHNDFQRATAIARAMVTEFGMSKLGVIQYERRAGEVFLGRDYMKDKNFSDQVALEIDEATREIINDCYNRAKKVLTDNKDLLVLIAEHLMEIETLTKEDIYELVNTGKLAWWEKKKAKEEAERIAKEKEEELQAIYRKQLEAMEAAKKKDNNSKDETR